MKRTKAAVIITAAFLVLILSLSLCTTVNADIGIGISPPRIAISDAMKGGTYERVITIFNTGDEQTTFTLSVEGECSNWIALYNEGDLTIPIDKVIIDASDKAKVVLKVDIPEGMANAKYTATVYVQSTPRNGKVAGGVAQAVARIPLKFSAEVTGLQILQGTVKSITTSDAEVGYPVKIQVAFKNDGNVVANPKIAVCIRKNGGLVDRFVHDKTGIKPGCVETVTAIWNTTGIEAGTYLADVDVSLDEVSLADKEMPFKILASGTLTREGELKSLSFVGEPQVNRVIKVVANFENTGTADTVAKFKGEIYRNGDFIDVLESDEKLVEVDENAELIAYYKIMTLGDYLTKGHVTYDGRDTQEEEVSFTVSEAGEGEGNRGIPGFELVSCLIALIICFMFIYAWKRV